jgi:hypothetical protein
MAQGVWRVAGRSGQAIEKIGEGEHPIEALGKLLLMFFNFTAQKILVKFSRRHYFGY